MSCCETVPICVGGVTYYATLQYASSGNATVTYINNALAQITAAPGSFTYGVCPIAAAPVLDVFSITQPLVAGNNVINHGLPGSQVEVEVRNAATGAIISARVVLEAAGAVTIFVPVAVASAAISIDA